MSITSTRSPARTVSVVSLFVTNGLIFGAWAAQIPAFAERLELSESRLGLVLLTFSIGAIVMMSITPKLTRRFGSERLAIAGGVSFLVTMMLPIAAPHYVFAACGAVLVGLSNGLMDVSMNAVAVAHEDEGDHPILSRLHGCWSLGGVVGALLSGWLATLALTPLGFAACISLAGVLVFVPSTLLWNDRPHREAAGGLPTTHWLEGWSLALILIAIVNLCGFVSEGAMADWMAKLMRDRGTSEFWSATVFAAFSAGMAIGRFAGDWVSFRIGDRRMVMLGAATAAVCLVITLMGGGLAAALPAMFVMGLGMANIVPIAFRHAGRLGQDPTASLAFVTIMGYSGLLTGPAFIGFVAEQIGLANTLYLIVFGLSGSAVLTFFALRDRKLTSPSR